MPRRLFALLVLGLVCAIDTNPETQAIAPASYSIRELGTFGGTLTSALAISRGASIGSSLDAFAWIVGYSRTPSGANRAFVFNQGELRAIGTLGGPTSVARSVNSDGHVVGESRNRAGVTRAFLYSNGSLQDLGALYPGGQSFARAISDDGVIVGASQTSASADSTRAFIQRGGIMSLLDITGFEGTKSVATDVNSFGQVVGSASTSGNVAQRAFLYDAGRTTDLGTIGGSNSEATAINDAGQVVGRSQIAGSSRQHAFLFTGSALLDLGTLGGANSEALDINDHGVIVGASQAAGSSAYRAFVWRDGTMTDLNTLLPPESGWVLERASGINFAGQIVGRGRFAGETRAFVMSPPIDVAVQNSGRDLDGNLPRPVQAGRVITWVLSVTNRTDLLTATDVTVTDTLAGDVEYVDARVEGSGTCEIQERTMECRFPRLDDGFWGELVLIRVRPTAAGEFGHSVRITHAGQADPDVTNNEYSESNMALSVTGLTLMPAAVAGGRAAGAHVTLNAPHPHGAVVRMASSNPSVARVPETFIVLNQTRSFNIIPAVVSAPTTVQISATYGLVTKTSTLTVMPPALSALQLTPTTVVGGCGTVAARVSLTGSAPASGAAVAINETIPAAQFPTSLTVPAGALIHTFTIPTAAVTAPQSATVTATFGGASRALTLTVRPVRASSLTLSPNPVRGGSVVSGVVTLECAAPQPVVVTLTSGSNGVAAPAVGSVTIPAGGVSAPFNVRTSPVTVPTSVPVHATVYGVRRTTILTVNP